MTTIYRRVIDFSSAEDAEMFLDMMETWDNGGFILSDCIRFGTTQSDFSISCVEEVSVPENKDEQGFNGWRNWETWNVALWISNDMGLYSIAQEFKYEDDPYMEFKKWMLVEDRPAYEKQLCYQTPDGALYWDEVVDTSAINEMIKEE